MMDTMARPPRFTVEVILDAAAVAASQRWRSATVADVAALLQTPANSVYYRFATKDALFGSLWLRAIRRFHSGLLDALQLSDPQTAAVEAAAHIPAFCRSHPLDAIAMTLYRQQDLVSLVRGQLRDDVRTVNDPVHAAMTTLTRRLYGRADRHRLALVATACQESGYGLVRRYLRHTGAQTVEIPGWLDDAVRRACSAILATPG